MGGNDETARAALAQARQKDPLAGIALGADNLIYRLSGALRDERGLNADLFLATLGTLAGYTCQDSLREVGASEGITDERAIFVVLETDDGHHFYFGDNLNELLFNGPVALWRFAAGRAVELEVPLDRLPDPNELAARVAGQVGSEAFGVIDYPPGRDLGFPPPQEILSALWDSCKHNLEFFCRGPLEWPTLMGNTVRRAMDMTKEVAPPEISASLIMQAATAMAKVDLAEVRRDFPPVHWPAA
ncbi:MAG: hypothetical protein LBO20_05065 [Bifidobacteriaceae bacterium]|jgi:hypothetical protein|nr:hypothetical protein [Bifidobacteriaceae bacterium]